MAEDDKVVIKPMMYLALSYDHRLVDGREAVTFLVRVKENLEDPAAFAAGYLTPPAPISPCGSARVTVYA